MKFKTFFGLSEEGYQLLDPYRPKIQKKSIKITSQSMGNKI
jgi:hypothetical protein